jgi:hypothetical protein
MVMAGLSFLMISNVPYPVIPGVGFRSRQGLIGLAVLVGGVSMLVFGKLQYFFPIAVIYVAFGLFRGVALGLIERRQAAAGTDFLPGGRRAGEVPIVESVGEDSHRPSGRRRRRRRSSGHRQRPDQGNRPPSPPGPPSNSSQ